MKKLLMATLFVLFLSTTFTSLEAGLRVRPSFGINFGTAFVQPHPYVVHRYPVYRQPVPVYVHPSAPVYYEEVICPAPYYYTPYQSFSFGLRFR